MLNSKRQRWPIYWYRQRHMVIFGQAAFGMLYEEAFLVNRIYDLICFFNFIDISKLFNFEHCR